MNLCEEDKAAYVRYLGSIPLISSPLPYLNRTEVNKLQGDMFISNSSQNNYLFLLFKAITLNHKKLFLKSKMVRYQQFHVN
jgi:hypothetical protein